MHHHHLWTQLPLHRKRSMAVFEPELLPIILTCPNSAAALMLHNKGKEKHFPPTSIRPTNAAAMPSCRWQMFAPWASVSVTSPEPHGLTFPLPVCCSLCRQHHEGQNEEEKSLLLPICSHNLVFLLVSADLFPKTKTQFTVLFQIRSAALIWLICSCAISCWIALKRHGFLQRISIFCA